MSIEKYVSTSWQIESVFGLGGLKLAAFQPEQHMPAEIERYIADLMPDPRCAYVHVIAMSDGQSYGSNLNGDVFRADELTGVQTAEEAMKNPGAQRGVAVPRYKTFEQAKFFRHHANGANDQFYGDVQCAAWNDVMRRVELIIRIFKEAMPECGSLACGAPDIIAKLDARGYLVVSMGCRIHHEKCLACGNENEFVSQRCDCLKNHMNEILPNGQLVAADNFWPRFFDLSDVSIPADPIAMSLAKVAAMDGNLHPKLTNEAHDAPVGPRTWRHKKSEIEKEIPSGNTIQEKKVAPGFNKASPLDAALCQTLMKQASLDEVISTLTYAGVMLSPDELMQLTAYDEQKRATVGDEFIGFERISPDLISQRVFEGLRPALESRSGFLNEPMAFDWTSAKVAEAGFPDIADYYRFYRNLVDRIDVEQFTKVAFRHPLLRELLGNDPTAQYARTHSAVRHLADTGALTT